jgi:SAM-dependent methyltransferase
VLDSLREKWDAAYQAHRDLWSSAATRSLVQTVRAFSPREGHALDFGCGTGRNTAYLASAGWHVTGVELSDVALSHCLKRAPTQVASRVRYLRQDEDWKDKKYDLVICLGVLHSYPNHRARVLTSELVQVLRPPGILLASFFCGCRASESERRTEVTCGGQAFSIYLHTLSDFASWTFSEEVAVLKHGDSYDQHGEESEHVHHSIHLQMELR